MFFLVSTQFNNYIYCCIHILCCIHTLLFVYSCRYVYAYTRFFYVSCIYSIICSMCFCIFMRLFLLSVVVLGWTRDINECMWSRNYIKWVDCNTIFCIVYVEKVHARTDLRYSAKQRRVTSCMDRDRQLLNWDWRKYNTLSYYM